jgi:hypothetical protein
MGKGSDPDPAQLFRIWIWPGPESPGSESTIVLFPQCCESELAWIRIDLALLDPNPH